MKMALLVIDVQRGLFDGDPRPDDAEAVLGRIHQLVQRARALTVPVIWIQHERPGTPLEPGSEAWQLARGLDSAPDDLYVRKTTPDSFQGTDLQARLDAGRVRHVVVCGYASEFCVDTTVRRAASLGYAVTLASDAHTTHDKAHASGVAIRAHENATLPEITSFGPTIRALPAAEVFPAAPLPNKTCPLCGQPNDCRPADTGEFSSACWCRDVQFSAELLARVPPASAGRACICRRCAESFRSEPAA